MRRAKSLAVSLAALLALAVAALTLGISSASAGSFSAPLYAGQTQLAGHVDVTTTASTISVLFVLDPGFVLTQAHVDVELSVAAIPQKNGNPIPGQFAQSGTTVGPYVFTGLAPSTRYVVAAHAVVWNGLTTVNVVSSTNTDVTKFNGVPVTPYKAVAANEPFSYPDCNSYTPSDASPSLWDNGIGSAAFSAFSAAGADWIWNTLNPIDPIMGEYATFQNTFNVGLLSGTPTLMITADNGYTAALNGSFVGSAQLGPGFATGELRETVVPGSPQTGDWGVASQGWQTVETYNLSGLHTGTNTLDVTAADEYMWNAVGSYLGPDFYFAGYNPVGGPIVPDPAPGLGSIDGSQCNNPGYNPGGVIYKLSYNHYTTSNTAWGAGGSFSGSNWATYITVETDA